MSEISHSNFWVILPAAGIGSRMAADRPKQYLKVAGQTILEHTINCFLSHPAFQSVVLGLSKNNCIPITFETHDNTTQENNIITHNSLSN